MSASQQESYVKVDMNVIAHFRVNWTSRLTAFFLQRVCDIKGVLNPNFRPYSFELNKK